MPLILPIGVDVEGVNFTRAGEPAVAANAATAEAHNPMLRMVGDHDRIQLANWIQRFFQLWARNQWKRERYAPSFHLDDENLDPKTWCRFPILSGGFERELKQLEHLVRSEGQHDEGERMAGRD